MTATPDNPQEQQRAQKRPPPEAMLAVGPSYRTQLTPGANIVDPATWTGSFPVAHGIAPRVRIGTSKWFNLLWLLPIGLLLPTQAA